MTPAVNAGDPDREYDSEIIVEDEDGRRDRRRERAQRDILQAAEQIDAETAEDLAHAPPISEERAALLRARAGTPGQPWSPLRQARQYAALDIEVSDACWGRLARSRMISRKICRRTMRTHILAAGLERLAVLGEPS